MKEEAVDVMETAVHEAGHVVVGLAMGRAVQEVTVAGEEGCVLYLDNPWDFNVLQARRALTMDVAGLLAEDLFNEWSCGAGWLQPGLRQALMAAAAAAGMRVHDNSARVSNWARQGWKCSDVDQALFKATVIRWAAKRPLWLAPVWLRNRFGDLPATKGVLAEIFRAERRAEKILKFHWAATCKLASSLVRRVNGRMTGKQVAHCLAGTSAARLLAQRPLPVGIPRSCRA